MAGPFSIQSAKESPITAPNTSMAAQRRSEAAWNGKGGRIAVK